MVSGMIKEKMTEVEQIRDLISKKADELLSSESSLSYDDILTLFVLDNSVDFLSRANKGILREEDGLQVEIFLKNFALSSSSLKANRK